MAPTEASITKLNAPPSITIEGPALDSPFTHDHDHGAHVRDSGQKFAATLTSTNYNTVAGGIQSTLQQSSWLTALSGMLDQQSSVRPSMNLNDVAARVSAATYNSVHAQLAGSGDYATAATAASSAAEHARHTAVGIGGSSRLTQNQRSPFDLTGAMAEELAAGNANEMEMGIGAADSTSLSKEQVLAAAKTGKLITIPMEESLAQGEVIGEGVELEQPLELAQGLEQGEEIAEGLAGANRSGIAGAAANPTALAEGAQLSDREMLEQIIAKKLAAALPNPQEEVVSAAELQEQRPAVIWSPVTPVPPMRFDAEIPAPSEPLADPEGAPLEPAMRLDAELETPAPTIKTAMTTADEPAAEMSEEPVALASTVERQVTRPQFGRRFVLPPGSVQKVASPEAEAA